jgi:choline dehydrogenase-like flavoprotein
VSARGFLNRRERATLRAVCDTFVPGLDPPPGVGPDAAAYWRRAAADLGVAAAVEETLALESSPAELRGVRQALALLERPAAMRLLTGEAQPFSARSLAGRERALRAWAASPLPPLRQAFLAFKRLSCFHFFAHAPDGANPNATFLGYPGMACPPAGAPANPRRPLEPLRIDRPATLEADVCVVGSGAGGAVAAALLAAAGRRVVILETGGWNTEADFDAREERGWERLYLRRGALTTADVGMLVLAGRTLGGGTTVNWSTCFRPPAALLAEWAARAGEPALCAANLDPHFEAVERRLRISTDEARPLNANNAAVYEGARALGLHAAYNPRNAGPCAECGVCHFGCRWGAKQGAMRTYLQDAYEAGARLVPDCHAERVLLDGGRVLGVRARLHPPAEARADEGPGVSLIVRAPVVLVAGGAIESPALLLRSGVRAHALGRNLFLHPSTAVAGEFDAPVEAWRGPMQAAYSAEFADLTGDGYGVRLEAVPLYPGFAAIGLPWDGARPFRAQMGRLPHYAATLALTRDRRPGRVVLGARGEPILRYRPGPESRALLVRGSQEAARTLLAAGARAAFTLHNPPIRVTRQADLARFDAAVERAGAHPHRLFVGSAHQMGTCRMGARPADGVVNTYGAVHGLRGLYVCDTSLFPTASGVNPMLTVLGLAHWMISRALAANRI